MKSEPLSRISLSTNSEAPGAQHQIPVIEPEGVSVETAGAMLGVGRSTAYGLIQQGLLPSFKIRKRRLVRPASVRALAESLERTA